MKTAAVICEYNPFHNGHRYLNDRIKHDYADATVAIMSTSFTQRGDVAVFDKFTRAKTALNNGVDLVVELPVVYAVSNAEIFAKNGVAIAKNLNADLLCFGSEKGDIDLINSAAKALQSERVNDRIKEHMSLGNNYPVSLQKALCECCGEKISNAVNTPNDVLGVEYCKAALSTQITPVAIKRYKVDHDSSAVNENFASASMIRQMLENKESAERFLPQNAQICDCAFISRLEKVIMYKLRTMTPESIKQLPDVSEGLENRIFSSVLKSTSVNELLDNIKTKRYTMARLRRILIYALLDIDKNIQKIPVPYIRVLGFNDKGAQILKGAKSTSNIPIITKTALGYKTLFDDAKKVFDKEILASNIYSLACENILPCNRDFLTNPIVIK